MILGTAAYMSPEQAAGKPLDARSDIFSFGSVLYEMSRTTSVSRRFEDVDTCGGAQPDPKPAGEISRSIPRDLERIISRCLRKEPGRRFQHMGDLKVALEELKEELDSGSHKPRKRNLPPNRSVSCSGPAFRVCWFRSPWLPGWLGRPEKAPPEAALTAVPLTSYPGWELSPVFLPTASRWRLSRQKRTLQRNLSQGRCTQAKCGHLHQAGWSGSAFPADGPFRSGPEPCMVSGWPIHRLRTPVTFRAICLHRETTTRRAGADRRGVYASTRRSRAGTVPLGITKLYLDCGQQKARRGWHER